MEPSSPAIAERRKRTRQHVELPIELTAVDGKEMPFQAVTRNISSGGGVCFRSPRQLPLGSAVNYVVTLSPGQSPVKIACCGRVIRCVKIDAMGYESALTMASYHFLTYSEARPVEQNSAFMAT